MARTAAGSARRGAGAAAALPSKVPPALVSRACKRQVWPGKEVYSIHPFSSPQTYLSENRKNR